jgi:hypothetical protein
MESRVHHGTVYVRYKDVSPFTPQPDGNRFPNSLRTSDNQYYVVAKTLYSATPVVHWLVSSVSSQISVTAPAFCPIQMDPTDGNLAIEASQYGLE